MRPGLSTPFGSKPSLTRLVSAASDRILRLEHRDRGAHGSGRAHQRRVAAGRRHGRSHQRRMGVVGRRQLDPDEAAGPVVEHRGIDGAGDPRRDLGAAGRSRRDAPERPLARALPAANGVTSRTARHSMRDSVSPSPSELAVRTAALRSGAAAGARSRAERLPAAARSRPGRRPRGSRPADVSRRAPAGGRRPRLRRPSPSPAPWPARRSRRRARG